MVCNKMDPKFGLIFSSQLLTYYYSTTNNQSTLYARPSLFVVSQNKTVADDDITTKNSVFDFCNNESLLKLNIRSNESKFMGFCPLLVTTLRKLCCITLFIVTRRQVVNNNEHTEYVLQDSVPRAYHMHIRIDDMYP